ncbi:MAG TPA: ABC transporter ATP-binding protein [Chloroflexota bacterium]|nr:ABC transporter ATP-binding protein [Chloroflexota bacterium]
MAMILDGDQVAGRGVATAPAIEATGITKEYGDGDNQVQILKGVDLTVRTGETLAIMGPSGSGKSTLLGCISGLDTVTGGTVVIGGEDITRLGENALASVRNRRIGFVFQTFNLIGTLSAQENVELPILLHGHGTVNPARRARELLDLVGLSHRRKHRPGQMSGGEQQRVAIARALANDPAIVFGDEPTGNLDSFNGELVMNLLTRMKEEMGKTLILVTHDARIAQRCDRTVYMHDGRLTDRPAAS